MKVGPIVGAAVAAVLGAIIWAVISATTGYEVGYVAWGIGLIVGAGAMILGGKGQATGVACAVLALASIFVGKMLAVQYAAPGQIREALEDKYTRPLYDELVTDATDFAQLTSEDEYPAFMVSHGFTEAEDPAEITEEELADFKEYSVESMRSFREQNPTYEQWREEAIERTVETIMGELPVTELVMEDLGLFDVIFALLGLVTAYKIGRGQAEEESASSGPPTDYASPT